MQNAVLSADHDDEMTAEISSPTSTSHTMTDVPGAAPPPSIEYSDNVRTLLHVLHPGNRHSLLEPSAAIPTASLRVVKSILETFAADVSGQQEQRLKEGRKRKRKGSAASNVPDPLKLRKVFVDGFETEQVWQQAKKIIVGVLQFSERRAVELLEKDEGLVNDSGRRSQLDDESNAIARSSDLEDSSGEERGRQGLSGDSDSQSATEDAVVVQDDGEVGDDAREPVGGEPDGEHEAEKDTEYDVDPHGLNDGFFSIDDFNRQTQRWEDQDAQGELENDQDSDEEAIQWDLDPLNPAQSDETCSRQGAHTRGKDARAEDEDEEEDDGPTFGKMALDVPEGESEDDVPEEGSDGEGDEYNANGIFYEDFFAPPPKTGKRGGTSKSVQFADQQPEQRHDGPPAKQDVERAMADVRRDLFDDESDADQSEDALSEVSAGDPRSRRSAHERRQAKLAEEIRRLEAASVAKREWTLAGEAAAADRPVNSLLEEDLDFEHVGKPVPVVTPDVSESIEALIKRRILAQEFDEVRRRRPDADSIPASTRRGLVTLDDTKSSKGLADIYAEEHVKNANPDSYVAASDEKLQREEKEIESLWQDLCGRLDALSSWHYRPKPAAPTLSVVADVATVSMEDAQPATAQGVAGAATRLAPQEVYRPGEAQAQARTQDEVVTRGGMPLARDEMSREDRARRRRRNKERVRKAGANDAAAPASQAARTRALVGELKKGGVRVINRRGELTDVEGRKKKPARRALGGSFKL